MTEAPKILLSGRASAAGTCDGRGVGRGCLRLWRRKRNMVWLLALVVKCRGITALRVARCVEARLGGEASACRRARPAGAVYAAAWRAGARSAQDETWAAKRACARLSDSHVAAFRTDGFTTLRQAVPPEEFEDALVSIRAGSAQALEQLAAAAPPRALSCLLMGSTRFYLLGVAPAVNTRVPGLGRFRYDISLSRREAQQPEGCAVLLALDSIDADEFPEMLYGSHLWPPAATPRNLAALPTWTASLQRGDCLAMNLDAAWRLKPDGVAIARWYSKTAVMVFGGDGASGEDVREVWWDDLSNSRGYTPTTVVQWSKGVPPPNQQHYT